MCPSSLSWTVRSCLSRVSVRVSLVCPFISFPDGSLVSLSCVHSSLSRTVCSCLSRVSVRLSPRWFVRVSLPEGSFVSLSCVRSSLSQTVRLCLSRVTVPLSPRRFVRVSLVCPLVSLPEGSFVSLSQKVRSCLSPRRFVHEQPSVCHLDDCSC